MRRASIDRINSRYRGTSAVSPVGHAIRGSAIRGVSPVIGVAPTLGVSHVAPAVYAGGHPSVIAGGVGLRGSLHGRGTSVIGGPVYGSTLAPAAVGSAFVRNSTFGAGGLRTSAIVSPPVYEVVENPPVYEAVTTPGKVYEIVTPIVEVAPDTVIQTDVVTVNILLFRNKLEDQDLWLEPDAHGGVGYYSALFLYFFYLDS